MTPTRALAWAGDNALSARPAVLLALERALYITDCHAAVAWPGPTAPVASAF